MSIFNNMELKNQEVRKTKFQKFDNRNSRDSNIESQDFRISKVKIFENRKVTITILEIMS